MSDPSPTAKAGPSCSPSSPPRTPPTTHTSSSEQDNASVSAHLANRRRRSSLSFWSRSAKQTLKQHIHLSSKVDEEDEGDLEEELRKVQEEQARLCQQMGVGIKVMREGKECRVEDLQVGTEGKQEYVWDVLFENQRGIYFLGKAYFSSSTLLPIDPSPFTVPSHPIPSASSFSIKPPGSAIHDQPKRSRPKDKPITQRSIKTLYTPETYQTPSPEWEYLTPWMINMRIGTDELGWRYNAWFRQRGWGSHAGAMGWGGWVRRREWVRLRCLRPTADLENPSSDSLSPEGNREEGVSSTRIGKGEETLSNVLSGEGEIMEGVLRSMNRLPLDRLRLAAWEEWIKGADTREKRRLEDLLKDEMNRDALRKVFQFHSTFSTLIDLLIPNGLDLSSPPPPRSPSNMIVSPPISDVSGRLTT
ncbi:hypothetical protein M231_05802 [Tremella mesenterica]|uniref:Peroxin domain-containing protein n=1 Tax=Tremella mesenterica TaxID=5217 RepID=A0A4Q1BH46_TREME|nr:hypothetical protein M231_05802 [Tremella mesenterica]